jgi:hypothetical protein
VFDLPVVKLTARVVERGQEDRTSVSRRWLGAVPRAREWAAHQPALRSRRTCWTAYAGLGAADREVDAALVVRVSL